MEEAKFCENCGQRNSATAKFCRNCSKVLPVKRGGTAKVVPKGKHRKPDKK